MNDVDEMVYSGKLIAFKLDDKKRQKIIDRQLEKINMAKVKELLLVTENDGYIIVGLHIMVDE